MIIIIIHNFSQQFLMTDPIDNKKNMNLCQIKFASLTGNMYHVENETTSI